MKQDKSDQPGQDKTIDPRMKDAWRVWLATVATNADAAITAAQLYAELGDEGRDAWLDALTEDVPMMSVTPLAIYGPLLTVEQNPKRRARICRSSGASLGPITGVTRALLGTAPGHIRIATLMIPLYLDFVRILACRFVIHHGFEWVRQDPIVALADAPTSGMVIDGVTLFASSTQAVVDDLSHAVLAHRRSGRVLPPLLQSCADLFSAKLSDKSAAGPA